MNTALQKWLLLVAGIGAGWMVLQNPKAFATVADAFRKATAGSIVEVSTGGKGKVQ